MGDTAEALLRRERAAWTEDIAALTWAHFKQCPTPPQVTKARDGLDALMGRREAAGWRDLSRDEKRLCGHYKAVLDAHDAEVLEAFRNR